MIVESFTGSGTYTANLTYPMYYINVINDGTASMTLSVNADTFAIGENEAYDATLGQFTKFIITSAGAWRAYTNGYDVSGTLTAKMIMTGLRYDLRDMDAGKISPYQLIDAINFVVSLIGTSLSNYDSSIVMREYTMDIVTAGSSLPLDFGVIVSAYNQSDDELTPVAPGKRVIDTDCYKIMNTTIYGNVTDAVLVYKCRLPRIVSETDLIYLPNSFEQLIRKYAKAVLQNAVDKGDSSLIPSIQKDVYELIGGREYSFIEREAPFSI